MNYLDILLIVLASLILILFIVLAVFVKRRDDYKQPSHAIDIKHVNNTIIALSVTVAVISSVFVGLLVLKFKNNKSKKYCWKKYKREKELFVASGADKTKKSLHGTRVGEECINAADCVGLGSKTVSQLKDMIKSKPLAEAANMCNIIEKANPDPQS